MSNPFKYIDVYILCGGLGKRLRKLNLSAPKPMVKVGGRPFLDMIIASLADFGFRRFILGLGYKADFIRKHYSHSTKKGLSFIFSREKTPLGTGGALKHARRLIRSRCFFVLNGDSFCKFDPRDLLRFHRGKKALATILLRRTAGSAQDCGEVKLDGASHVTSFQEKNRNAKRCLINSGVYIFDKKIFKVMPRKNRFSLEHELFPGLVGNGLFGRISGGYFIDIGTPVRYFEAKRYFSRTRIVKNQLKRGSKK